MLAILNFTLRVVQYRGFLCKLVFLLLDESFGLEKLNLARLDCLFLTSYLGRGRFTLRSQVLYFCVVFLQIVRALLVLLFYLLTSQGITFLLQALDLIVFLPRLSLSRIRQLSQLVTQLGVFCLMCLFQIDKFIARLVLI